MCHLQRIVMNFLLFVDSGDAPSYMSSSSSVAESSARESKSKGVQMSIERARYNALEFGLRETQGKFSVLVIGFQGVERLAQRCFRTLVASTFRKIFQFFNFSIFHVHAHNLFNPAQVFGSKISPVFNISLIIKYLSRVTARVSKLVCPHVLDDTNIDHRSVVMMPTECWKDL